MKKTALKLTISCVTIGILLGITDMSAVWTQIRRANGYIIAVSMVSIWIAQAISSLRWQWILRAEGVNVPFRFLFVSYMIGMFANALLPTSIGGDIVKTYDLYRRTRSLSLSISSVFIERFSGFLVLIVLSWVAIGTVWRISLFPMFWGWVAASAVSCGFLLFILKNNLIERSLRKVERGVFAGPAELARKCYSLIAAYRYRKMLIMKLVVISVPVQLLTIFVYQIIGASLEIKIPFIYYLLGVPLIILISLLPISLGGLGVREAASVFVFGFAGVSNEAALSLAVLFAAVTYLASLLGGIFLTFRKSSIQEISDGYKFMATKSG